MGEHGPHRLPAESAYSRVLPAVAEANVNKTLEIWWAACTEAACDFQRNDFWRMQAFAIGLTEATQELRVRCCSTILHLHGKAAGEVGLVQCTIDALSDARRFHASLALCKELLCVHHMKTERPSLKSFSGQAAAVIWYCAGYMHYEREAYSLQVEPADTLVPRVWHYGPDAMWQDDEEWHQYSDRWATQMQTAQAWAGKRG